MARSLVGCGLLGVFVASLAPELLGAGEVAIYTGATGWIDKAPADAQAQICADRLTGLGVDVTIFSSTADDIVLAEWVSDNTGDGQLDVLVLYGYLPSSIYGAGNSQPDGSIAEAFIESTDGDAILNHADYMFYVSSTINAEAGLQNMMDIPGITMWGDNTPVNVTAEGRAIAPSLTDFLSDRPFHVAELAGDWFVEAALAQDAAGTLADPVVVRDGDRGRLIPCFQTNAQNDPKGAVAAEIIAWLFGIEFEPAKLGLSAKSGGLTGESFRLGVELQDAGGGRVAAKVPVAVSLGTNSPTGRFDTRFDGAFDGTVTSVTIPAGESSVRVFYKETSARTSTLTASAAGLAGAALDVTTRDRKPAGEVAIYTGQVGWIDKAPADAQAQICADRLTGLGVDVTIFSSTADDIVLAEWVSDNTGDGQLDVLVLYGYLPSSIYGAGNSQPDGSIAEAFIESTDGDAILNHADYMFYVSSTINAEAGLQNMMDIPGITMWGDNTPVRVTDEGRWIAPSLADFLTDRPFHVAELAGDWFVEASLAEDGSGLLADPVIVRDGDRGRLIPCFQTAEQNDPKGAVAAEIIGWLFGAERGGPAQIGLLGRTAVFVGQPLQLTVQIQDLTGSPSSTQIPLLVNLATNSITGAFDLSADGAFDRSVRSVTIPAGESSAVVYYKDSAAGTRTLSALAAGLTTGTLGVKVVARSYATPGEVVIYTGAVNWIDKAAADAQAQICVDRLASAGIPAVWYANPADDVFVEEWMAAATGDTRLDVLVLYGYTPSSIYPAGNASPDGSTLESFLESTDGDAVINHADYMFYVSSTNNDVFGLQNVMDIPAVTMWGDDTPMAVTAEGRSIAPSLNDYLTDRPLHLDELDGNWLVEAVLAQDATGTRADPVIVRDGDRGRLIPCFQTNAQNDPKGAVAAEIIAWLMRTQIEPTKLALSGAAAAVAGTPVKFRVSLADDSGTATPASQPLTVNLTTSSATGAFDTVWDGPYGGSSISIPIPAGERWASFYYKDARAGTVTLSASASGAIALEAADVTLEVLDDVPVAVGEVAIYTGATWWIDKAAADEQAQITIERLNAAGISNVWFSSEADLDAVADWVSSATNNGSLDVLVIYGHFPRTIYPSGNLMPDGSIAEAFIESTDGDMILNHADYMFYVGSDEAGGRVENAVGGLQNMMDIPGITMWDDDTPMTVTHEGSVIAPSLADFLSDRPFHVDELAGEWFVEAALAENATGTRADPIVVRDGNRGRLAPVFQAYAQDDPKGAVAAEIIIWLMNKVSGGGEAIFRRGDANDDGGLNITDGIFILNYLFLGGPAPPCEETADSNDDGGVNITDGIFVLNYLFLGGPAPPAPGPDVCGPDPAGSPDLGCASYTSC